MNMAIRGIAFTAQRGSASNQREAIPQSVSAAKDHFGNTPANSFSSDQHPDYVMANPPFNISEWCDAKLEGDPRWRFGNPPRRRKGIAGVGGRASRRGNANFAWIQHMLHHLAPQGSMALLLANGSMSSGSGGEGQIRQALIEADLVECMVALPGLLFTNTQIPACIWFLAKRKEARVASRTGGDKCCDRSGTTKKSCCRRPKITPRSAKRHRHEAKT